MRGVKMRIGMTSVVILVLAGTLACGNGAGPRELEGVSASIYDGECVSPSEQVVTLYSGRSENLIEPILEAFECQTGTQVAARWGSSTQLALLLEEERDRSPADVFLSRSPGPVGFLEATGVLAQIDEEVLGLVDPQNRAAGRTWVGVTGRKRVVVYNVDALKESELPGSIFDLTDSKWSARVAIPGTNGSFLDWFTVFRDRHGTDVATRWLDEMVANDARYYPNNRSIVEAVGRGEIDIGLVNHYYNHQEQAAMGDSHRARNHDLSDTDIGSLLMITAATIPSASQNRDLAHELLKYLLSEPVQRYVTNDTFEYPLAAGVAPAEILPALSSGGVASVDFDALGGGFEETTRIVEASGIQDQ